MNITDLTSRPSGLSSAACATFLPDVGTLWRGKQRWYEKCFWMVTLTNQSRSAKLKQ